MNLGDRVLAAPSRAEAIRAWLEVRLKDWLEHRLEGPLARCGPCGWDAQPSQFGAARLRDHPFPHGKRSELPRLQVGAEAVARILPPRPGLTAAAARRPPPPASLVAPDPRPRYGEDGRVTHEVEQVVEPAIKIIDRPLVQLGLDPQYLRLWPIPGPVTTPVFTNDLPPWSLASARDKRASPDDGWRSHSVLLGSGDLALSRPRRQIIWVSSGSARRRLSGQGRGGAVVVIRGRESRSHGEGRQRVRKQRDWKRHRDRPGCTRAATFQTGRSSAASAWTKHRQAMRAESQWVKR